MFRVILASLVLIVAPCAAQNTGLDLRTQTVSGYIQIPDSPTLGPSALTVEAWITYDGSTLPAGWVFPTLIRKNMAGSQEVYFLRVEAGNSNSRNLKWRVRTTAGLVDVIYPFTPGAFSAWTHVAATYDGAMSRLFINGTEVRNSAGFGPLSDSGGMVHIGAGDTMPNSAWEVWNGGIDEFRLWPFARTGPEIMSTMNIATSAIPGGASNWNLDNNGLDWSGTNHGTVAGPSAFSGNSLALSLIYPTTGAINTGTQTNCNTNDIQTCIASLPNIGNNEFGFVCTGAPASTSGFFLVNIGYALPAPFLYFGLSFWVDPISPTTSAFTVLSDSAGVSRYPVPLPNALGAVGIPVTYQYGWTDFSCNPPVVLSNALQFFLLP